MLTVMLSAYLPSARRRLMTERSERMSEEAENHQNVQYALSRRGLHEQTTKDSR